MQRNERDRPIVIGTSFEEVAPHPDNREWDADATRAEIIDGELAEAEREERGDVPVIPAPHDPSDPAWKEAVAARAAWRDAAIAGRAVGPMPELPSRRAPQADPGLRDHLRRRAADRRRKVRPLIVKVAAERCEQRRRRAATLPRSAIRAPRRHGARRRTTRRLAAGPSRGDPGRSEGDGEPPGYAFARPELAEQPSPLRPILAGEVVLRYVADLRRRSA